MSDASGIQSFIIAAIDFGSAYSGYAYSYKNKLAKDPTNVFLNHLESDDGMTRTKVPTVILFDKDKKFHSFGYQAERKYAKLAEEESHEKWRYFKNFKMQLYNRETVLHRKIRLRDEQGRQMLAVDVFAASIRYLADHLLDTINLRVTGQRVNSADIEWLLTVPAIWTDGAKQFMQLAAIKAGLPETNISLALEPEAAAVYISQTPLQVTENQQHSRDLMPLENCMRFMVIDLGGGTVDMTFHEIRNDGGLNQVNVTDEQAVTYQREPTTAQNDSGDLNATDEGVNTENLVLDHSPLGEQNTDGRNLLVEIHAPEGGQWGGNLVNEDLEVFMQAVFTEPVWEDFKSKQDYKEIYLDLLRDLEASKRKVDRTSNEDVTVTIPFDLIKLFETKTRQELGDHIRRSDLNEVVSFIRGKLRIRHSKMRSMFERSLQKLIPTLRNLNETLEVNSVSTMVLVGGFSESNFVQQSIREKFDNKSVIVPEDPSLAVLKGAVIYGYNKSVIQSRIMKHTYGISIARTFRDGVDPEKFKVRTEKGFRCENVFNVLIRAGEAVYLGTTSVTRQCNGNYNALETDCAVSIYISSDREPMFVTDPGCKEVGSVQFSLDKECAEAEDRMVDVTLNFGHTRITVVVKEHSTGDINTELSPSSVFTYLCLCKQIKEGNHDKPLEICL